MLSVDLHPLLMCCFLGNTQLQFFPPNWPFLFYLVSLTVSDTDDQVAWIKERRVPPNTI